MTSILLFYMCHFIIEFKRGWVTKIKSRVPKNNPYIYVAFPAVFAMNVNMSGCVDQKCFCSGYRLTALQGDLFIHVLVQSFESQDSCTYRQEIQVMVMCFSRSPSGKCAGLGVCNSTGFSHMMNLYKLTDQGKKLKKKW